MPISPAHPAEGLRITVRGTVQGVGMRPFVYRLAESEGVRGRVRNDAGGVTIEAFAGAEALRRFVARLEAERPPAARYDALAAEPIADEPAEGFVIVESAGAAAQGPRVSIPADLATCPDCLRELFDPADRRHRYPFINCTNCGPRFTIARGVPYDRPLTTMAPFALCADCRREYEDPRDRRFHAEPNACPACGPHLTLLAPDGRALAEREAALTEAARALADGRIVAVKGVGGFHLACDARSPAAVARLRLRKRREEKPLAVMPRDLAEAELLCALTDAERALLASPERPIVLAPRRAGCDVAPEVAPDTPLLGLLLPYAPLHHLLLAGARRPLVMTSANLSEEPIAYRDEEAVARLGGIADLLLVHDREIETRADDSVARVVAGAPLLLRRSRGWAPRPVPLARPLPRPVLAVGALLKNTFCLAAGDAAHLGPHIGDLENLETLASFEGAVVRLERFLRTRPALLAHDLHPDFASTRWALERARAEGLPAVAVQHHHAHAAGCMAEHGLAGPALALTWDGTGLGDDGAAWGGELLLARYDGYARLATLRPIPLAGGDKAIREPWRLALAVLDDAFAGDPPLDALPLFRTVDAREVAVVRRMIASGFNAPRAHGVGRLFDALGALALARPRSAYEGQLAMALEAAAAGEGGGRYALPLDASITPWQLDWRPLVREAVADLVAGLPASAVALRFHGALAWAGAEAVRLAAAEHGRVPVVLSGGCFANARLTEGIFAQLQASFSIYLPRAAPPGDGGIALGQAVVAAARAGA